jgi:hypothetical protein
MNTAYPGARVNLGGKGSDILFNYVSNLLITFLPSFVPNQTEASEFLGLFPFTELLATALLVKRFIIYKNVDKTALVLLLLDLFLMIYIVFGFPEWLAKLTLLSSSLPTRALTFVTLLELLLLLHLAAHYKEALFKKKLATLICMAAIIALSLLFVYVARRVFIANSVPTSWLPIAYFVAFAIILALACLFIISKRTQFTLRCFTIVGITCALLGSILVNPVMQGIQAVTNKPLYSAVRQIQSNSPGIWISGDVLSNYLITAGAPTISSNNTIPILQRWHLFDSEGKYDYTYNRFASMELELTNEPTTFVLNVNQIILKLNIKDLETLGVNYLVTNSGVKLPNPKDSNWNGKLDPIYDEYGIIIYKVSY